MALSLFCRPHQLAGGELTRFAEAARLADEAGFHSIHLGEHVLMGDHPENYPFGAFEHDPSTPWLDPLIALAAAAAVTSRLRLSTGVILAALRPGPVLAKSIASLDVLSGGRMEPGMGVGWQPEEFEACGVAWEDRYRRFDEVMRTCRVLWGEQPTAVPGRTGEVAPVRAHPRPVQPRLPMLMGLAPGPRNARRIAEYGDGWCPVRFTPDQVRQGLEVIRPAYVEAGRDPGDLVVRVQAPLVRNRTGRVDVPATLAVLPEYEAAGATVLAVGPTVGCSTMSEVGALIEAIAEEARRVGGVRSTV